MSRIAAPAYSPRRSAYGVPLPSSSVLILPPGEVVEDWLKAAYASCDLDGLSCVVSGDLQNHATYHRLMPQTADEARRPLEGGHEVSMYASLPHMYILVEVSPEEYVGFLGIPEGSHAV